MIKTRIKNGIRQCIKKSNDWTHGVSHANILTICSYYFHLVGANPLNIDWMGSWLCKQMLYKLHKLIAKSSRHYYLLENIRIIFHQSSRKADPFPHYANSCHQGLNLHFIYKISVQDTPLLSSNKKVIMSPDKIHHTWTEKDPNASTCIIFNYFT